MRAIAALAAAWLLAALLAASPAGQGGLIGAARAESASAAAASGSGAALQAGDIRAEALSLRRLDGRRAELELHLSAPAAWRAFTLDAPRRLALDFDGVDWRGLRLDLDPAAPVRGARYGLLAEGRSRLVLDLAAPLRIRDAALREDGAGRGALTLLLEVEDPAAFAAAAGWPDGAAPPRPVAPPVAEGPPVVVIDPGHGGLDPGAIRGDTMEKDLVMLFAADLRAAFERAGTWRPVMTRTEDHFLTLRDRVAFAEEAGAKLFLSIHVNALETGYASGASVHTLSTDGSSEEAAELAAFENRSDVLAGVELAGEGDDVARALVDLARRRTDRRSQRLAAVLVETLDDAVPMLEGQEHERAGFRVLKSPTIPSALIELGFMSTPEDLERIRDPDWRARFAAALVRAADLWRAAEAQGKPAGQAAAN